MRIHFTSFPATEVSPRRLLARLARPCDPADDCGMLDLARIARLDRNALTRSISAENPTGAPGSGGKASVGDDVHTTDAARELGQGWKVRPCLRMLPGETHTLAEIDGPGIVQHMWITVDPTRSRLFTLRVYYDGSQHPSIECPVCDFFANGIDGKARITSIPIAVNPTGGMNSYWPLPFRKGVRITISNDWPTPRPDLARLDEPREEFFYQITWSKQHVGDDDGYLHCQWRRSVTTRDNPEHVILDGVEVPEGHAGHYVGTYLIWNQFSNGWWGEGEVKFFIDDDDWHPTICGTGTEDYFGGAWGFAEPDEGMFGNTRPIPYSGPLLGYPQAAIDAQRVPAHGLYRWHVPDPIRFRNKLRVTVQALGWYPTGTFQPLTDDIISLASWYQSMPVGANPPLPGVYERLMR